MMDITVKTLDGQNRTYCIPENITVKQFKEKIANSININADVQRLIFQGRVMQDEKLLKEYDVHGKVIHVVQRLPPAARPPGGNGSTTSTTSTPPTGSATQRDLNRILIGSFNVPTGVLDPNNIQNDGHSLDVHIHLGQIPGAQQSESQLRIDHARRMLGLARENLDRLDGAGNDGSTPSSSTETQQPAASSPMDTTEGEATPASQQEPVTQTTDTASAPSAHPATSTQEETSSQANATPGANPTENQPNQPRGPIRPNISVVATMLEEVHEVNRRLQPYLERYQEIVRADAQLSPDETVDQQLVCNRVGEILHAISHCYHSLSDLMVDLSETPPRQLYAAFVPVAVPTAVIHQAMPLHAQINVGVPRQMPQRSTGTQSSVPTSSQSTTTSQASNNAASQTPPQTAGTTAGTTTGAVPTTATPGSGSQSTPTSTGATGSAPTVTRASTDPYVFVEVGPDHAVTVNSITAHVISSEGETPSTSASHTGSTTTGPQDQAHNNMAVDLIQNIVTSVMQAHGDPRGSMWNLGGSRNRSRSNSRTSATVNPSAAGSNPVTNSSGTQTTATSATNHSGTQTQTSATNSSGTQTGARPQAATLVLPRLPGAGLPRMPGNSNAMDPFLPCSSRHFLRYQARNMQNQAGNGNNVEQEGGIGGTDAISELMVNLLNEVNPHLQGMGRPSQPANSSTATTSSSSAATGTNSQTSSSTTTTTTSSSASGSIPMFNPFAGLMQGMAGMMPGGAGMMPGAAGMMPGGAGPMPQFARMPMPNFASMFGQMAQGMQGLRPTTTVSSGTRTTPGTNPQEPAFVQQLRSFLQTNENPTPPTTTSGTPTTESSSTSPEERPNPVMTDEAFTQLVRGISGMVTQTAMGNPPTESISDFLSSLGDFYSFSSSGEGFFNDIFNCVSAHLTFPDLIQVFYGNRQPLNRVRVPLQDFIRQRVLQGEEPTPENLEVAVDRLIADMHEEIEACSRFSEVKADIDLTATLNGFFKRQMIVICRMILNSDETNTNFGAHFYERVRRTFAELVVLTRSCLVGGQPDLERLIQNRLTYITRGVNPMIQQWMVGVTTQQLNQFLPTITILEEDVSHFIVKKSDKKEEVKKKDTDKSTDSSASTSALSMETSPPTTSPGAAQVESPEPMELHNGSPDASVTSTSAATKPKLNGSVKPKTRESPGAAASGQAWEAEVPQDWVPIISLDVEKQKHQRPQPPLSDTYLQGMPAKRRKIMPQEGSMSMSNPAQTIPESLRRAVAAAGVEPISNMENLTNEASDNKELEQAFDEQVASSIEDRLGNDSDYKAERFPNTEQYYRKNKK